MGIPKTPVGGSHVSKEQTYLKCRQFDDDFKIAAVDLIVKQGYSFQAAAKTVDDLQKEIRQLRKTLQQSEMEREILKKTTAYFAKESL